MSSTSESLEEIDKWANESFPNEFRQVKDYIERNNICFSEKTFQCHPLYPHYSFHKIMDGVVIGETGESNQSVYACIHEDGSLFLVHEPCEASEDKAEFVTFGAEHIYLVRHDGCFKPCTRFKEPFNWLCLHQDSLGAARLEAFVQYLYLTYLPEIEREAQIEGIKKHFEGACKAIAAGMERPAQAVRLSYDRTPENEMTSHLNPNTLAPANEPAVPAAASRKRLRTADEVVADTKNSLLEWMQEAQAADRQELEQLRAQIHALEMRAVNAEQKFDKYKACVTAAKLRAITAAEKAVAAEIKVKKAEEEAAKLKKQNEKLRQDIKQKTETFHEEIEKMFLDYIEDIA